MLVSFPMDDTTLAMMRLLACHIWTSTARSSSRFQANSWDSSWEKGGLWQSLSRIRPEQEDSWDYSWENAALSKCNCSAIVKLLIPRQERLNGLGSPLGIETSITNSLLNKLSRHPQINPT